MKRCNSIIMVSLILGFSLAPQRAKGPPPRDIDFAKIPGKKMQASSSYWIAPFVKVSTDTLNSHSTTTVTWYSEEGPVNVEEVNYASPTGYAMSKVDGQNVFLGISDPLKLILPPVPDHFERHVVCAADSRMFVDSSLPNEGAIGVRLYIHGKLANTIGPFVRHRAEGVHLGEDGAGALLIWKDDSKTTAQIVLTDGEGNLRACIDCEDTDRDPIAAPNGIGAILPLAGVKHAQNNFTWYTPKGRGDTFEIGPNPTCLGWVPETAMSLFSVGPGYEHRYQMIDWAVGKALWNIPCPGEKGYPLAIAITPKLVIFSVAELYKPGPWGGSSWMLEDERPAWIRTFHAFGAEDSAFVAKWQAQYPTHINFEGCDRFVRVGPKLYYLTAEEFTEISEEDILANRRRWQK